MKNSYPLVSVIVATRNEERNIANCLESVFKQTYQRENIEVILVDNNSTDRTKKIAEDYGKEIFRERLALLNLKVFNQGPERSAQRNFGVDKSSGKYVLYLDADMTLSPGLLEECVEKMEGDNEIVAMYIPEIIKGSGFLSRIRGFEREFYNGTVIDATRFMYREIFKQAGGFDEKLYACEDWDLDKRIKKLGKFSISQKCLFHDEANINLKKYIKKKQYYSKNFDVYIEKWGKEDPDVKKQFGFTFRLIGVFMEKGKWKKLLRHPLLAGGMLILRFFVGLTFLFRNSYNSPVNIKSL